MQVYGLGLRRAGLGWECIVCNRVFVAVVWLEVRGVGFGWECIVCTSLFVAVVWLEG